MPTTRTCTGCGQPFEGQRATARFCSDACRQRAHRGQAGEQPPPGDLSHAVRAEVVALGALDTAAGQLALALARSLESSTVGAAATSRELRTVLSELRFQARRR